MKRKEHEGSGQPCKFFLRKDYFFYKKNWTRDVYVAWKMLSTYLSLMEVQVVDN
jgi:hypothetical protein